MIQRIQQAYAFIRTKTSMRPRIGLVLGSGLGGVVDSLPNGHVIDCALIPGFPASGVQGHAGRMHFIDLNGLELVILQGRVHGYEGFSAQEVIIPTRVCKMLGVQILILTNAAGAINETYKPGELVLIRDHINLSSANPLTGPNLDEFGPRFSDMSNAYDKQMRSDIRAVAVHAGISLHEGVYAMMAGPSFETPAEIRMLRLLGADLVGMSTVPEVIAANHCGMKVAAISCATNMAAGILDQPLSHQEVMETGSLAAQTFNHLLREIISSLYSRLT